MKNMKNIKNTNIDQYILSTQIKIAEAYKANEIEKVLKLQRELVLNANVCWIVVKRVMANSGNKTLGVDLETKSTTAINEMVNRLLQHHERYMAKPARRIYIEKANGKKRPLSIPTLYDRCVQELYRMAIVSIAETQGDDNSFGFRQGRSTRDALIALAYNINGKQKTKQGKWVIARYVIDADIKSLLDNIDHQWIMANIPMDKRILNEFLKAGYIEYKGSFHITNEGIPQVGVISPVIVNMVLDGLEAHIMKDLTRKKVTGIGIKLTNFVRYVDDFMITYPYEWMGEIIKKSVIVFLTKRGLNLSKEKIKIIDTLSTENGTVNYLGCEIMRQHRNELNRIPLSKVSADQMFVATRIPKIKINNFIKNIRKIVKSDYNKSIQVLVDELNSKLREWGNYYVHGNVSQDFRQIDQKIFHIVMRWIKTKFNLKTYNAAISKVGIKEKEHLNMKIGYISENKTKVFLVNLGSMKLYREGKVRRPKLFKK